MGSSTLFAIIVGPLSILHIILNVYVRRLSGSRCRPMLIYIYALQAEYFGSPIGVWKVRSKMFYTFTELIFMYVDSHTLASSEH